MIVFAKISATNPNIWEVWGPRLSRSIFARNLEIPIGEDVKNVVKNAVGREVEQITIDTHNGAFMFVVINNREGILGDLLRRGLVRPWDLEASEIFSAIREAAHRQKFPLFIDGRIILVHDTRGMIRIMFRSLFTEWAANRFILEIKLLTLADFISDSLDFFNYSQAEIIRAIVDLVSAVVGEYLVPVQNSLYKGYIYVSEDEEVICPVTGISYWSQDPESSYIRKMSGSRILRSRNRLGLDQYHAGYRPGWKPGQRLSFELEVEVGLMDPRFGDAVRRVWDAAECDRSLSEYGAELIVGFVHISKIEEKLRKIVRILGQFRCKVPNERYGFHVSASISGWKLSEERLQKLASAFYGNEDLVFRVARRFPNRYCEWIDTREIKCPQGKYYALRKDGDRLEFRIFRASTDYDELLTSTLLVEAMLKFALSEEQNLGRFLRQNYPQFIE